MRIIRATYGGREITGLIQARVSNSRLHLKVNNDICGDPKPGVVKHLDLEWESNGVIHSESWKEGTICSLPRTGLRKLGIFYSNNHNPKTFKTIELALKRIEIAAAGKAEILTCLWNPINSNPFTDIRSWYQQSSHLNQVLQIMQLLYTAREMGEYDYVSFLEHDCLYPQGYFDYPDFEPGTVLCNMNYMGLCTSGWQGRGQNDQPASQLTMRFSDAISHFEKVLPNALVRNSGLVEPQVKIQNWHCQNPSIHVNHGHHFTSHFSIYRTDNPIQHNLYWGDSRDYSYLFE